MNDNNSQDQTVPATSPPVADTPAAGPITSTFTMDPTPPVDKTSPATVPPSFSEPSAPEIHPGPPDGVTLTESAPVTAPPLQKLRLTKDNAEPEEPASNLPRPVNDTKDSSVSEADDENGTSNDDDQELIAIKQQALARLQPLISHLNQTPEEKFKTIMMMIQAADDQSLINEAYEAADKITDDKLKAQALLDVVNEINYFTHKNDNQDDD